MLDIFKLHHIEKDAEGVELVGKRLNPTERLLLIWLKLHKADEGEGLTASLQSVGDSVGVNRNAISTALNRLDDSGYIVYTKGQGQAVSTIKLTL